MIRLQRMLGAAALIALVGATACNKKEAPTIGGMDTTMAMPSTNLSVTGIELGKAVGVDKRVSMPMTTFGTRDTIYASVATSGAPPTATLSAVWSFSQDGQTAVVDSSTQSISPTGDAVTEFHVSRADAWPTGTYKVEVFANGASAGSRDFEVR